MEWRMILEFCLGFGGHFLNSRLSCSPGHAGEAKCAFLVDSGVAWPGCEWGVAMSVCTF